MTFPIGAIGDALPGIAAMPAMPGMRATDAVRGTEGASGEGFAAALGRAVDGTQALQAESKTLAIKAVTGELTDIHAATIASSRAQVTLELVAAIRNKGVDAFNEIMRMQA
ncbi:flagellar hook-basal body complex protein FliE [Ruicaihuangia caeni]|uniref:flagellar hook-basal body complex protein FliE n=1 Tax=Ruicaihuangia caeni TaxID=3042517 RepID=UPI003F4979CE